MKQTEQPNKLSNSTQVDIYAQEKKYLIKKAKKGTLSSYEKEQLQAHKNTSLIDFLSACQGN